MRQAFSAGTTYFAIVFALSFALGALRVLFLVPRFGECGAALVEIPVMLAFSWFACRWIVGHLSVPRDAGTRLEMGAVAFGLLMLAEVCLGVFALGRSVTEHLAGYASPDRLLGLAAQVAFGLFPLIHAWTVNRASDRALTR
jgi:hypothetical protein